MPNGRAVNPLVFVGVGVVAVAGGWWLVSRLRKPSTPPPTFITQAEASAFALSWALSHAAANSLTLIGQTRIRFFTGKPPRMTSADWLAVGGTPTRSFWYVEFNFTNGSFLTVMIDAITGEKPPVTEGWVVDTMSHAFGI